MYAVFAAMFAGFGVSLAVVTGDDVVLVALNAGVTPGSLGHPAHPFFFQKIISVARG
jgi:hypothetical protein